MKEQIKDIIRNNAKGVYPLADIAAAEILALFRLKLSMPSDEDVTKQAVKYGTRVIEGHKPWKQTNQMKIEAFLEGANYAKGNKA